MDRGGRNIPVAYLLTISLVVGLIVILGHPDFRMAALSIIRGERDLSPVWISNETYYPEIGFEADDMSDVPEIDRPVYAE